MKRVIIKYGLCFLFIVYMLGIIGCSRNDLQEKRGILLVTFGTSIPEAGIAFDNIQKKTAQRFPDTEIRWAYTSGFIRKKLAKQGKILYSVREALAMMYHDGVTHVSVQSLHIIAGAEYDEVRKVIEKFKSGRMAFKGITLGKPLLSSYSDLERTATALLLEIPASRKNNEAVIFMGHGSEHHPADLAYAAMVAVFKELDPLVFIATVEGQSATLEKVLRNCKKMGVKKAYLMPFMSVAGDHARNDMAGDKKDSWKNILTENGIEIVPVLKGMAEYDSIVDIWLDHLEAVSAGNMTKNLP